MQFVLYGIISGSAIALLAIALQLVYLPTRILFIGLAGIYAIAPYFVYLFISGGMPYGIAILLSILICCGLSMVCELFNHGPLSNKSLNIIFQKGSNEIIHFISSLGIYIVLAQVLVIIWGTNTKSLNVITDKITHIGNLMITGSQWIIFIISWVLIVSFWIFLTHTEIGLRLRAMANNPKEFSRLGYNIKSYRIIIFCFAGLFAAFSSILIAYDVGFDPYNGLNVLLIALVAVIIGGQNTFKGPVVGALLIGILRELVAWQFSSSWKDGITFLCFAIFLFIRPQGLFGILKRLEAKA